MKAVLLILASGLCSALPAAAKPQNPLPEREEKSTEIQTATLKPEEIAGFESQPATVQEMLKYALLLTSQHLSYKPGSSDPASGGTDCSGFIYHLLQKHGHADAPRQSNDMYEWVWKAGTFRACNSVRTMDTFEFAALRAGDLLFWVNSTRDGATDRDPPVTHVMIYLGKKSGDGRPVAAGASDGRSYGGRRMNGVSVFDFQLPAQGSNARFIGYARLPEKGGANSGAGPLKPAPPPAAAPKKKKSK